MSRQPSLQIWPSLTQQLHADTRSVGSDQSEQAHVKAAAAKTALKNV